MRGLLTIAIVCLAALSACGDDAGTTPLDDGGIPDAGDASFAVEAPTLPAAPTGLARPCPTGYAATDDGACDPWPDGPLDCGSVEIQVPGSDACERLGPTCPGPGEWATDLPASGPIRYVRADAAPAGDGTRDAPFATIGEAAALSGAGDVIAVAEGEYDEAVSLRVGVTLHGACAEGTVIAPSFGAVASVSAAGEGVVVRNATLGGGGSGLALGRGTGARLENVLVLDNSDFAIRVLLGGVLEADGLIVRGTRPAVPGGAFGRGLDVEGESSATLTRTLFENNTDFSIFAALDSTISLDQVVVRVTRAQESDGAHGRGLNVIGGADAVVRRSVFEDGRENGVLFTGEGTTGLLEDVVIRRTSSGMRRSGAGSGTGLAVEVGASVEARGLLIEESRFSALAAISGATFAGEDVVIDGVGPDGVGDLGIGLTAERASTLSLSRAVVRNTRTVGVSAKDEDTRLVLEDVLVANVDPRENDGDMGMGAGIVRGAAGELRRVRIEDTSLYGIFADGSGTRVTVEDVAVVRTGKLGGAGFGLIARDAATIDGSRVSLEEMSEMGILVGMNGARVALGDVSIRDVTQRFLEAEGVHYGAGIQIEDDGEIALDRVHVANAAHHAVFCFGGVMRLTDLHITSPREDDSGELGYGLTATEGADVTLERTLAEGVFGAGIAAFGTARVVARQLEVRETRSNTGRGKLGWGVAAVGGGTLDLEGARLIGNREASIMSRGAGSRVIATDVVIDDTRANVCGEAGRCVGGAGFGVSAYGGEVDLRRFSIRGSALAGVQILDGGGADLREGVIADNPIGVNVQGDPDYDFSRLTQDVRFVDNDRNVDSEVVPLPDTSIVSAGLPETPTETPAF